MLLDYFWKGVARLVLLLRCFLCSTGTSVRVHLGANIDAEKFVEGGEMNLDTNTAGFTASASGSCLEVR